MWAGEFVGRSPAHSIAVAAMWPWAKGRFTHWVRAPNPQVA